MKLLSFVVIFVIAAGISTLMAVIQHSHASSRCSLDGIQVRPLYEVVIIQKDETPHKFSCVVSARIWFRENSERVSYILVTDEVTGEKIDAEHAFYVESEVITTQHTENRIHVFTQEESARSHAKRFNGKLVKNPFSSQNKKQVGIVKYKTNPKNKADFLFFPSQNPLSLPNKPILIKEQNCSYIYQKYYDRLSNGYSSPPYKPPKNIS